jgi:hypothetical protein
MDRGNVRRPGARNRIDHGDLQPGVWHSQSLQSRNLLTGLVTLLGGSSLLLSRLGLYGVVSYGAGLRLREFAIRTALGARAADIRLIVSLRRAGSALFWMSSRRRRYRFAGLFNPMKNIALIC